MADLHTADTIGKTALPADMKNALHKAYQAFANRSNFCGVDIGYRWQHGQRTKDICLRLHVQRKLPIDALLPSQVLPTHVDGIALDVIEAAYQPSLEPGAARRSTARQPFTMGGLSCGRSGEGAGTIGLVVIDKTTGKPGILSNWHVLAGPRARCNDPIMQVEERNDEFDPRNHIANLKRWMLDRSGDAALAELLPDQPWLPLQFGGFDSISSTRSAELGELLNKTSHSPNSAQARVDGRGLYRLQYETRPGMLEYRDIEGLNLVYDDDVPVDSGRASFAGDSGSAWVSTTSGDAVALQIGGEIGGQITSSKATGRNKQAVIACEIEPIFEKLKLRLASFEDLLIQNSQSAVLTHHQKAQATFSHNADEATPSPLWPHPQHWADSSAPQPQQIARLERHETSTFGAQIVPMVRILPNGRLPAADLSSSRSRRYNIGHEIWQNRLYPALLDYDPNFQGVFLDEAIAQRISAADDRNIHAFLSRLINGSARFDGIGLKQVLASDFRGATSYFQICDRIEQLLPRF
ncbi:hypothetical protein [Pseudophaeobacter sp. EL27]|uniref:hypothetical protein n=1 Tax=Pseudophaeobacter sp. EL27 TaxID=2107580 RepID=UPI000EFD65C4|nr:hypothetical protein [Pseudophaeobacter sp. EL27]